MIRISRYVVAGALAAGALLPAPAAQATAPCSGYFDPYAVNVPGWTNCMINYGAGRLAHVAACTGAYDPFAPPFGSQVAPETVTYVNCVV